MPFLVACALFAAMAAVHAWAPPRGYAKLIRLWGVHPVPFLFLDTETVLSGVRCLRAGIDVFAANPCDPLGRVYDYSPLWLLLAHLPVTPAWTRPAGLAVDAAFLMSLLLLPPGRSTGARIVLALGAISPAAAFALDRANNDLVLFALAGGAATLVASTSPARRACGYALALLAGLLKYYPLTLLALASRERPRNFVLVVLGAGLGTGLFLLGMGHDLGRALQLIPTGSWYNDMFGAASLPGGIAALAGQPGAALPLRIALSLAAIAAGAMLARSAAFADALAGLAAAEQTFLLAGALLILGCFFTAQNIGYRAIHLLLVLPAFARLGAAHPRWRWATGIVLALLWSIGWRHWLEQFGRSGEETPLRLAGWAIREGLWWLAVPLLIGCVLALLTRGGVARALFRERTPC